MEKTKTENLFFYLAHENLDNFTIKHGKVAVTSETKNYFVFTDKVFCEGNFFASDVTKIYKKDLDKIVARTSEVAVFSRSASKAYRGLLDWVYAQQSKYSKARVALEATLRENR